MIRMLNKGLKTTTISANHSAAISICPVIASQWIYNAIFPVKNWSVFMQPVRTNNDIEGWHNALNRRANCHCSLPFYILIQLLDREARLVEVQMRLVADHKLTRIQRKKYRVLQAKLHDQWEQYQSRSKTSGCLHQDAYIRMPTRLRQEANSPTPNGQLAYVGELTIRRRRVGVGEFARRRVDRIPDERAWEQGWNLQSF